MASLAVGLWSILLAFLGVSPAPSSGGLSGVLVTPAISSRSVPAHSGVWDAVFYVKNTTTSSKTYNLSCSGVASCAMSPTSVTLAAGAQIDVDALYTTGDLNPTGSLVVSASGGGIGSGSMALNIGPSMVLMTGPGPDANATQTVHRSRPVLRADFVLPSGEATDTNSIKIWWKGVLATSGTLRRNAAMLEWEVPSDQTLAPGDTGTFKVQHCLVSTVCTTESRIIQLPADQKPVVDFVGMPFEATGGGFSAGFGPGLAVSGVDVTTGFATPAYVSMGSARSAALVYSTRTSYPRALVAVDLNLPWGTGTGDSVFIFLRDSASVKQDSLKVPSSGCKTGTAFRCRLVLQASYPASISTGVAVMNYSVEVTVKSGATTKITTEYVPVVLVDRRTSPYGSGWWPAAGIRLYAAGQDRVLVGPTGTATIYRGSGDSLYLPPPGSTTNLVKVSGGWELRTRGTPAKVVFDANGRLLKGVDASGNRDSLTYDGYDRLAALIDPTGRSISFRYGSGATGKLDSIVSLSGSGSDRRTRVSIDIATNQLRYDSLPSPTGRPIVTNYAYQAIPGGSLGTVQLQARWGRSGIDSVFVTYDSSTRYRPRLATLRAPLSSSGDSVRPVQTYRPADLKGWKGFVSLDSIYVEVTDPRGNWTRALLTRYAQSIKTWDAIDTLGRAGFDGFGRTIWAEGRTVDSSRVYTSYDSLGRADRTFVRRTSSDTLWLSRLTFDANDRVVKRLDPLGHADSMAYDSYGRPVYTRDVAGNVTRVWYRTDGLVDSMLSPTSNLAQHFTYTSSFLNPRRAYVAGDSLLSETQYDAQGIANGTKGKLRVRLTGSQSTWRWRLTTTWRDAAGRPDSSTVFQTAECSSPCNAPGTFTRITSHYVTYDSLGQVKQERDSGTAVSTVAYIRDRLGRVIESQRNGAQGDSLVYDLAGNVVTTVTRRGYQLQASYDSRNRDTSSVIPGYGTVKRAFGGPDGQLTALTVASLVDPIGGVEPGRKWSYDKRGRLLSDTLWTGVGQPRATSYTYDSHDRLVRGVDARDTSGTRASYDTALGRLSGLHTPFGDSLRFTWDAAGRPQQAQVVPQTGRTLTQAWTFTGDGMLQTAGATLPSGSGLAGYDAGTWADYGDFADANQGITLLPEWTRQDGDGTALHSEKDSLRYDGLERLTRWKGMTDGALVATDTFTFDGSGNLAMNTDTVTFETGTNRLTLRRVWGTIRAYTYDAAGNLARMADSTAGLTPVCRWFYSYDALDRLTTVRIKPKIGTDTVLVARYAYDVLGNRIARRVYATVSGCTAATPTFVRYAVQGGHVLFETDSAGSTKLREYVWGLGTDDLVAIRIPATGDTLYAVKDQLGTIRAWVTRAGTWRWGGRYHPYGVQAESRGTSPDVPYAWAGREYDPETGFYFLRARYYDPTVGRFTQEDPIGFAGGSNLYAYVDGQPLEATDPSGTISNYLYGGGPNMVRMADEHLRNAEAWTDYITTFLESLGEHSAYVANFNAEKARQAQRNCGGDLVCLAQKSAYASGKPFTLTQFAYAMTAARSIVDGDGMNDVGGDIAARLMAGKIFDATTYIDNVVNVIRSQNNMSIAYAYTAGDVTFVHQSTFFDIGFTLVHEQYHVYGMGNEFGMSEFGDYMREVEINHATAHLLGRMSNLHWAIPF